MYGGFVSDLAFVNIFVLLFNIFSLVLLLFDLLRSTSVPSSLLFCSRVWIFVKLDWRGLKGLCFILNQFDLEEDQITIKFTCYLFFLFSCTTIFEDFAQCKMT